MEQNRFSLDYLWILFSFAWFGIGSALILYFLLFLDSGEVEKIASDIVGILFVIIWGLSPFGLANRMKRYWGIYIKESVPKFFLKLFIIESFMLYGTFIFCGFFLIPLKIGWHIPFLYLKIFAGVLTIPLVISIFFRQRRKFRST